MMKARTLWIEEKEYIYWEKRAKKLDLSFSQIVRHLLRDMKNRTGPIVLSETDED